jgi:hypothetical protein
MCRLCGRWFSGAARVSAELPAGVGTPSPRESMGKHVRGIPNFSVRSSMLLFALHLRHGWGDEPMEILHVEPTQQSEATAFKIPDLMLLGAWSEFHDMRMAIDLAHCMDGAERDEVIVLSEQRSSLHWMLWRSADGIVVQPMLGMECQFDTISDALESVRSTEPEELTNIHSGQW